MDYDVVFIGSGQGAWNGAIPMAKRGLNVAIIESSLWGGTCTNRGCNAKFTLDRPAELVFEARELVGLGIDQVPKINWADLMAHKQDVIGPLSDKMRQRMDKGGVHTITGHAQFVDAHTLRIDDRQTITADKIVIVTGQVPHRLDVPGRELMHDSTDFLSSASLPDRLTVIGAGYIGMEAASIASLAGADVTLVTDGNAALRSYDQTTVDRLVTIMRQNGVKFIFNQSITAAHQIVGGIEVTGDHDFRLETDYILDATGRVPNTSGLNLAAVNVQTNAHGIVVNDHLQTGEPNVYATGDVIAKSVAKITPTAVFESHYLADLLTDQTSAPIRYPNIAVNVFTMPRLASVGISPAEARQAPERFRVETVDYAQDWFHQSDNEMGSEITLIYDQADQLVGAVDMSNQAPDTINTLLGYMELGVTKAQLDKMIYIFPSNTWETRKRIIK
ncbi:glutathione reductase [Levilactobacillus bambusae]|uniref:Glutathione reductase n=2 Tax=Levilactobacillus bambusae TaxID=2024736 RepID=A0A2V1N0J9_9LACO|nr:glutathione reductase [Levilactobacillus bambusae]